MRYFRVPRWMNVKAPGCKLRALSATIALQITFLVSVSLAVAFGQSPNGMVLFRENCAKCHDGSPTSRAPSPDVLRQASAQNIMDALVGSMRVPGARLNGPERRAVAEAITGKQLDGDTLGASTGRCTSAGPMSDIGTTPGWNGWGPDLTNARFQPHKAAGLTAEEIPRLKLQWAFGYPDVNIAWGQPTIAGGRLFVGSQNGTFYSLNARSGCIYWVFSAGGGVRTAPSVGRKAREGKATSFISRIPLRPPMRWMRRLGAQGVGTHKVDSHPLARITGAPALYNGRLYVPMSSYEESQGANPDYGCCSFRGSITALDASNGDVAWKKSRHPGGVEAARSKQNRNAALGSSRREYLVGSDD